MNKKDYFRDINFQEKRLKKGIAKITGRKKIIEAFELAREHHKNQKRDEGDPYLIHLVRVANTLIFDLKIRKADVIVASLLHDIIEDTDISFLEIKNRFGGKIARWVLALSRDKARETKEKKFEETIAGPKEIIIIKACDVLDNVKSLKYRKDRKERWLRHLKEAEKIYIPFVETIGNNWLTKEIKASYKYEKFN
ncbi:MAG: HD domain-containing protein [Candidatus Staskawiczbacteria bacterium]|nr:HD domain-containing protein [Candidatus Staskawiczbacteria bacterium]